MCPLSSPKRPALVPTADKNSHGRSARESSGGREESFGAALEVRVKEMKRSRKKIRDAESAEERSKRFRVKGSRASELANLRGESLK
jgi:hypothetical protein